MFIVSKAFPGGETHADFVGIGTRATANDQWDDIARPDFGEGGASLGLVLDRAILDAKDPIAGLNTASGGRRAFQYTDHLKVNLARLDLFGPLQPQEAARVSLFLRLLAHQEGHPLGDRPQG